MLKKRSNHKQENKGWNEKGYTIKKVAKYNVLYICIYYNSSKYIFVYHLQAQLFLFCFLFN